MESNMVAVLADPQDCEVAAFLALVLLFEVSERFWPARAIDRRAHLRADLLSFTLAVAMNRIATGAVTGAIGSPGSPIAAQISGGPLAALQALPGAVRIALALVVVDFLLYWIHRAQHRFDVLWRTHAWHHTIEQLYWFSGFRTSFLHSLLYNIPQAAVPMLLFRLSPLQTGAAYAIGLFVQFWEHTNLRVTLGPLRRWVVTPPYHRIHHAAAGHDGMNLAPIFPVWDRMFGTYVDPLSVSASFPLGLREPVDSRRALRMLLGV
jgi:sterol desaturase/sphingolipid hydroxylase (fatty acid hydroxylase superfamily)